MGGPWSCASRLRSRLRNRRSQRAAGVLALCLSLFGGVLPLKTAIAQAPPGAPIVNQAYVSFEESPGAVGVVYSNEVTLVTAALPTPATLSFLATAADGTFNEAIGASACVAGGQQVPLPGPGVAGPFAPSSFHNIGNALLLRLADGDRNTDFQLAETVTVLLADAASGDSLTLSLTETGPNTGVFTGYVPTEEGLAVGGDCLLQSRPDSLVTANYVDPQDADDEAGAASLSDPTGRVFDSQTGALVNGAVVQLVDAATGALAEVFGNDGVSRFAAEFVTGEVAVDTGGKRYDLGDGRFRFPRPVPGDYRLVVTPPEGFIAPSTAAAGDIATLPDGPYRIAAASYGDVVTVVAGATLDVDIPVDPLGTELFLNKSTRLSIAAPGDFLRFDIDLENASGGVARNLTIIDTPPRGTRYVEGSARLGDAAAGEPDYDGETLRFALGDLPADARSSLSYVLEVVSGADGEWLDNTAVAVADGGLRSNPSTASVRVREDLYRSRGHLIGRAVIGACGPASADEDSGIPGVRVYLEDGRYAVSDETGRFHFEGVEPGRHVAQLDPDTVPAGYEPIGCSDDARFAGRSDSRFVDVTRGALKQVDFYFRRLEAPEGRVSLNLKTHGSSDPDRVGYTLELDGEGDVPVIGLTATALLPEGVSYRDGSARIAAAPTEPRVNGQALTFDLGDSAGDWSKRITFEADIERDVSGELTTRAVAAFAGSDGKRQKTPVAETLIRREPETSETAGYVLGLTFEVLSDRLSPADKAALDRLIQEWQGVRDVRITAVGHSDSTRIAPRSRHVFADNYALSRARAHSAARYLAAELGVAESDLSIEGRGPDDPVADNATAEGREQNRRVELVLAGQRPGRQSFLTVERESSGRKETESRGDAPALVAQSIEEQNAALLASHLEPPTQVDLPIEALDPGLDFVLPEADFRPPLPVTRISIRHAPDQSVALFVNGLEVDPANFAGREQDLERGIAVSRWSGVDLVEGSNRIIADIVAEDGRVTDRLMREIHYAGRAVRAEPLSEASTLIADGRSRPRVALRLLDRFGEPARHSGVGTYRVDAPYRAWWSVENDRANQLVQIGSREPLYTIGDDGIAYIDLEPTTQSGEATLRLKFENDVEQEVRVWLEPAARDWILVGFGEGTLGYDRLSGNAEPLDGRGDGYYEDGRLAFFAKGRVRGDFLMTLAYDSARRRPDTPEAFTDVVDPDAWYTLYADATEQRYEAPSQRKLYVKLERRQFNLMFGDFSTGLATAELTRYERRLNGLASEFAGRNSSYRVFASDNAQGLVRDEIAGDGTSGLYRLSVAPMIAQSEQVRLETRDRFDAGEVLETRRLTRFLDYDIDPLAGTLFFKQPVPSRDAAFNPIIIVVEYETATGGDDDLTAGGRAAVHTASRNAEFGVTHVNERRAAAPAEMSGADLAWQVTDSTRLRAEYAKSRRLEAGTLQEGHAGMVSLQHRSDKLDLEASYRDIDQSFGLGQQATAARGIRKLALDGRYRLSGSMQLRGSSALEDNLETGAERTTLQSALEYRTDRSSALLGVTRARDRFIDGSNERIDESTILDAGVSRRLFDSAMTMRANGSFALGGEPESADYLSSYVVGMEYEVLTGTELFVEYEDASGRDIDAQMTRAGVRSTPWSRAQLTSALTNEMSEFGPRLYANLGLVQGFQLNDRWIVDVGVDQTRTVKGGNLRQFDDARPLAFGSTGEDFTAAWVGSLYQFGDWSMNSRLELRKSTTERRTTLLSGWYREPRAGVGLSASLTLFSSEREALGDTLNGTLRVGWARRRADSPWAFLYRADLSREAVSGPDCASCGDGTWRVVSNLNSSRRLGSASELSLQYAVKYVAAELAGASVDGVTDLGGADLRLGFRDRWQLGMHASLLHSWRSGSVDYGSGLSLGYNLADDMWVSVGYNLDGFHDPDFSAARYTAAGPFVTLVLRAHQSQLKRIAGR